MGLFIETPLNMPHSRRARVLHPQLQHNPCSDDLQEKGLHHLRVSRDARYLVSKTECER